MACPNSANPIATRERLVAAACAITVRDGMGALSTRTVGDGAGKSASLISALPGRMNGIRMQLVMRAFEPLIALFEGVALDDPVTLFDIASAPLLDDHDLCVLVTQVAACAGLRHGRHWELAKQIDHSWTIVRDDLATSIPKSPLRHAGDANIVADRIIALYFAAAFHLARSPDLDRKELRRLVQIA